MRRIAFTPHHALAIVVRQCRSITGNTENPQVRGETGSTQDAVARAAERIAGCTSEEAVSITKAAAEVDPFRVGYNMGMQNVHLETLRTKLDDNRELIKSQLASLRETSKTNHESLRRILIEFNKQQVAETHESLEKSTAKIEHLSQRLRSHEDSVKELTKQQFDALQNHFDDRLENIKDTIKLGVLILLVLNLWALFILNQQHSAVLHPRAPSDVPISKANYTPAATGQQQHQTEVGNEEEKKGFFGKLLS